MWIRRLFNVLRPARVDREIRRELEFHLAEREDDLVAGGLPRDRARREARRMFGHVTSLREATRDADVAPRAESLVADVRYATRSLLAAPAFTAVAVASLALGIGANTAIFSLVNAVMLRSLPVQAPEELVALNMAIAEELANAQSAGQDAPARRTIASYTNPLWEQVRDGQDVFAGVVAFGGARFNLADTGVERPVEALFVSGSYFPVLGVGAAIGRVLSPADDVRGCPATAVLSHAFWRSELGGDPSVVGKQITLSGRVFDIVGVGEPGFNGLETGLAASIFVPFCAEQVIDPTGGFLDHRSWWFITVLGRMRPDMTMAQVNARLAQVSGAWFERTTPAHWSPANIKDYLGRRMVASEGVDGLSSLRTNYTGALLVLMGIVALVLLIACANVANLMLARASVRRRELAVRVALGASRGRLVQQLFVEGLLLSLAGAAIGVALAYQGSHLLVRMMASRDPVFLDLAIDARVLLFTIGVAVVTAVLFGLAPAWRAVRTDPQSAMQGHGGRGVIEGHNRFGIGKVLVSAQVALSLVLLTGAALLVGSFRALGQVEAGFTPDQVLVVSANLRESREAALSAQARLLDRLRTMPGVRSAASAFNTPLSRSMWNDLVVIDGLAATRPEDREIYLNEVSADYFSTLGMRLISGRDFGPQDRHGAPAVAVINQSAALRYFKHPNPVGQIFRLERSRGTSPPIEVIGVVADAKYQTLREPAPPSAFFAIAQDSTIGEQTTFVVKAEGSATGIQGAVTALFAEVHPRATLRFKALEAQVAETLTRERMLATLSGFFGVLAVLLAAIGLYGTMAYHVARRRGEIGIRLALGAAPRRVLGGVLREVGVVLGLGTIVGLVGVLVAAPLVQQFLFGLEPRDPQAIAVSSAILAAAAGLAGYLPARRAARLDPMRVLREE